MTAGWLRQLAPGLSTLPFGQSAAQRRDAVLPEEVECLRPAASEPVGRIAFADSGDIQVLPVLAGGRRNVMTLSPAS
jgi:hypothetical protein